MESPKSTHFKFLMVLKQKNYHLIQKITIRYKTITAPGSMSKNIPFVSHLKQNNVSVQLSNSIVLTLKPKKDYNTGVIESSQYHSVKFSMVLALEYLFIS